MFKFIKKHRGSILALFLEVIVIFIGLTLSFFFEDWNQNRKDKQAEKLYLESLYFDLSSDLSDLGNRHFDAVEVSENINKILTFISYPDSVEMNLNFFTHVMGRSQLLNNFSPTDYTFQDLTSSGHIALIKDVQLRKKLTMYYSRIRRLNEDKQLNNASTRDLLFDGVASKFKVAHLFSFAKAGMSDKGDTLDLNIFRDKNSDEFRVIQNYLLLRSAMLNFQAGEFLDVIGPLSMLRDELARKIGTPTTNDFIAEMKSGSHTASEVYESFSEKSSFRYVKFEFNNKVYELMKESPDMAVDLALFNVKQFPRDSNLFDTLGDVYLAKKDTVNAIKSYEKAISMNLIQIETREKLSKIKLK